MRHYPSNSSYAAGRILALSMIADGNLAPSEIAAMHQTRILQHVELDQAQFHDLMQELCEDLLSTVSHGKVQLDHAVIDSLLIEIDSPALRRQLYRAMLAVCEADEWLADGEAVLLARASILWAAETNFSDAARSAIQ